MNATRMWKVFLGTLLLVPAGLGTAGAQGAGGPGSRPAIEESYEKASQETLKFRESDWSGPRLGFMFAPGDRAISRRLREHGLGNIVSQFGWHFEHQVAPLERGPRLVTEFTPLFAGVEYGKVVPSATVTFGLRSAGGLEIGMGPSLTLASAGGSSQLGLVIAAGRSIDYGDVRIPLNLAVSTNNDGTMVTVLAGYAVHRR